MKVKKLIVPFILMTLPSLALWGQDKPSIIEHEIYPNWYHLAQEEDNQDGRSTSTPLLMRDFVATYMTEFNLNSNNELMVKKTSYLDEQMTPVSSGSAYYKRVTKYQQYYKGYEVESSVVIVHDVADTVTLVIGSTLDSLNIDTSNPISLSLALDSALNAIQGTFIWQDSILMDGFCVDDDGIIDTTCYNQFLPQGKLCLAGKYNDTFTASNYKFVWSFDISTTSADYRILVNAKTGTIYDVANITIESNNNKGSGTYDYGDLQTLHDDYIFDGMMTYKKKQNSDWILKNNIGNKTLLNNRRVKDSDNVWTNSSQYPATTAHWIVCELDKFYATRFHDYALTDNTKINVRENYYGASYTHCFNKIKIGKLNEEWCSTIDIIGHEMAHRLIKKTANLRYRDESGALCESFADIFGTLAERYVRLKLGKNWNWTIGEDADIIRDMANPASYYDPWYYYGTYWDFDLDWSDYGGIHTNCGVPNKWFYELSQSIGIEKAADIVHCALCYYMRANNQFHDALIATVLAAEDLYGLCSSERNAVITKWNFVGVNSTAVNLCTSSSPVDKSSTSNLNNKITVDAVAYPNPASDVVNIEIIGTTENSTAVLYNMMGIKVCEAPIINNMATLEINKIPNGLYYIGIIVEGKSIKNIKLIVNN